MKGLTGWIVLLIIILVILGVIGITLTMTGGVIGVAVDLNPIKDLTSIIP